MIAYYYASKTRKYLVILASHERGAARMEIDVEGKIDARKRAAFYGAKPWNF